MRLNGWQRLGVIISVCWSIFVLGATAVEYSEIRDFEDQTRKFCPSLRYTMFEWKNDITGDVMTPYFPGEKGLSCGELKMRVSLMVDAYLNDKTAPSLKLKPFNLAAVIVVPVIVFWVLVYLLTGAVKWVAVGFKKE